MGSQPSSSSCWTSSFTAAPVLTSSLGVASVMVRSSGTNVLAPRPISAPLIRFCAQKMDLSLVRNPRGLQVISQYSQCSGDVGRMGAPTISPTARRTASNTYLRAAAYVRNCRSAGLCSSVRSHTPAFICCTLLLDSPAYHAAPLGSAGKRHSTTASALRVIYARESRHLRCGQRWG